MKCEFDSTTHIYRVDGRPCPSVTQCLSSVGILPDFSKVNREILENKRQIGIALHAALHYLQQGDLDEATIDEAVKPRLDAYRLFVADHAFESDECEKRLYPTVNGMAYGGTLDVIGTIKAKSVANFREPVLVDFKTTESSPHPAWGCQTAAYCLGLKAPLSPPFCYRRYSLQLLESGKYRIHEWKDRSDYQIFKLALALTYWKINQGEKPWEENLAA